MTIEIQNDIFNLLGDVGCDADAMAVYRTCPLARLSWKSMGCRTHGRLHATSMGTQHLGSRDEEVGSGDTDLRRKLLHDSLQEIGFEAKILETAVDESIIKGSYDGRFGRAAIRTCRSFYYPKQKTEQYSDLVQLQAAALRTARQVDFLYKRHQAHQTEWIRHHDAEDSATKVYQQPFPLIILLDNVRSVNNVGSILRTADAAGCAAVWSIGITPHGATDEKLQKSALGAERTVPSLHFDNWRAAMQHWKRELPSYEMVGLETTERSLLYTDYTFDRTKGVILVMGNEVTGVDPQIMENVDAVIEIPMFGRKNSLNVAACAPIVLYEVVRQWNTEQSTTETES